MFGSKRSAGAEVVHCIFTVIATILGWRFLKQNIILGLIYTAGLFAFSFWCWETGAPEKIFAVGAAFWLFIIWSISNLKIPSKKQTIFRKKKK